MNLPICPFCKTKMYLTTDYEHELTPFTYWECECYYECLIEINDKVFEKYYKKETKELNTDSTDS